MLPDLAFAFPIVLGISFPEGTHRPFRMEGREMAGDTEHMNQSDQDLLERQFTTVLEHLINVLRFELPFILVLLDSDDTVVGNKVVQIGENKNVLSAVDFVSSKGAEEGLLYPIHIMVRDAYGSVAYGYLDDIDAQPVLQIVHVDEDE
jgi:hypothetical protein